MEIKSVYIQLQSTGAASTHSENLYHTDIISRYVK